MNLTTDDFFRLTWGFRIGETQEQLKNRIAEIVNLEARLNATGLEKTDAEHIKLRLRQLRDVDAITSH